MSLTGGAGRPFRIVHGNLPRFLTDSEAELLRFLGTPRDLDEPFFAEAVVTALDDPRGFLAECLRREILVVVS